MVHYPPQVLILVLVGLGICFVCGCASPVRQGKSLPDTAALAQDLNALTGYTAPDQSELLAGTAARRCQELAVAYRCVRPSLLHNLLVNCRLRQRGLCYHWAEDLRQSLVELKTDQFSIRWGIARPESIREHNVVVVTAKGGLFADGLVLDPWRQSGRLVWIEVAQDKYPWQELFLKSNSGSVGQDAFSNLR
jgi:hypothetical protein